MKASFIIPLYNCLPLTQAMLASLRETLPPGLACEIILVDDGSSDGTRAWLKNLPPPCRSILNDRNLGFAASCNRGAAAATGEFLFFLNNDLVLLPRWFEPMLAALARRADAGLVGNVQRNHATGAIDHAGIAFNHQGKPVHLTARPWARLIPWRRVDAVTGACFAIRRRTWMQLGGFDEAYVNGCEDVDLCLRAREAGFASLVALRSVVRHHVSASPGRKLRDEQNTAKLHRRWGDFILGRMLRPAARACLAAAWEDPRDYADPRLAWLAFASLLGLVSPRSPRLVAVARAALECEARRWAHLLEGAPAPDERRIAWAYFPGRRFAPAAI